MRLACNRVEPPQRADMLRGVPDCPIERGRDIASVEQQYYGSVRPMHLLHVAPSKQHAHLIVPEGGENAEALDVIVGKLKYLLGIALPG